MKSIQPNKPLVVNYRKHTINTTKQRLVGALTCPIILSFGIKKSLGMLVAYLQF